MTTEEYQKAFEELEKEIVQKREMLLKHKPLFRTALKFGLTFSKKKYISYSDKDRSYDIGYAYGLSLVNCVYLNLHLGENDSIIKDVGPIVEEMKEHPRYEFEGETDYIGMGWIGWRFAYTNGNKEPNKSNHPELLIRAYFEHSNKCRKVGTGKFEEVMKIECEE